VKLEQSFEVAAPVERVWQALIDVEHVAPCLPGAAITGRNDDGSYNGSFTVKIGPTTASYTGKLEMESVDEGSRTATMSAQGSDKRGQGGASAKILSRVEEVAEGRTRVEVDTDYHITGRLARFGRGGMIEDISERLLKEFAKRLAESVEGSGSEATAAPGAEAAHRPSGETSSDDAPPPPSDDPSRSATQVMPTPPPPPTDDPSRSATQVMPTPPPPPPRPTATAPPAPPHAGPPPPPPPPPANEPLDAGSLVGSVLAERVRANPWPFVAAVFVLWRLVRRRRA
jgi:uncharacterized protein